MKIHPLAQVHAVCLLFVLLCISSQVEATPVAKSSGLQQLQKRAVPFSGGMYGKRDNNGWDFNQQNIDMDDDQQQWLTEKKAVPFSGALYGKRAMPFNGGMYGKRNYGNDGNGNFPEISQRAMPFSGGMYGRRK